jgi:hypothetical protein
MLRLSMGKESWPSAGCRIAGYGGPVLAVGKLTKHPQKGTRMGKHHHEAGFGSGWTVLKYA